ncbi:MAG TPA: carbohydrate ABC transporter permease, partial [Chloroflexi bacterium]|nr:carbohydrate ABC transporter permease [Chloroflexota bacterium]
YLPPSIPALIAFGLSSTAWHWNEFLWPLVVTNSDASRPLTVGLVRFTQLGEIGARWSLLAAATLIVVGVLLVAFLVFQRRFIQSFIHSGIK